MCKVVLFCWKHILKFLETWEGKYYMCFRTSCGWIQDQGPMRKYVSAFVIQRVWSLECPSSPNGSPCPTDHRLVTTAQENTASEWGCLFGSQGKGLCHNWPFLMNGHFYAFCSFSCLYSYLSGPFFCEVLGKLFNCSELLCLHLLKWAHQLHGVPVRTLRDAVCGNILSCSTQWASWFANSAEAFRGKPETSPCKLRARRDRRKKQPAPDW